MDGRRPEVAHVTLTGEFDISNADRLAELLHPAEAADVVIVDMSRTTFIDLTALRCLVRLKRCLTARGGGVIRLVGVWECMRRIFTLARVDELFEFSDYRGYASTQSEPLDLRHELPRAVAESQISLWRIAGSNR